MSPHTQVNPTEVSQVTMSIASTASSALDLDTLSKNMSGGSSKPMIFLSSDSDDLENGGSLNNIKSSDEDCQNEEYSTGEKSKRFLYLSLVSIDLLTFFAISVFLTIYSSSSDNRASSNHMGDFSWQFLGILSFQNVANETTYIVLYFVLDTLAIIGGCIESLVCVSTFTVMEIVFSILLVIFGGANIYVLFRLTLISSGVIYLTTLIKEKSTQDGIQSGEDDTGAQPHFSLHKLFLWRRTSNSRAEQRHEIV